MKASCATSSTSRIADEPRQQPPELALVLGDEQAECLLVPALRALDQLLVNVAVRHRRLPVSLVCSYYSDA
jgi:hypothetical protein